MKTVDTSDDAGEPSAIDCANMAARQRNADGGDPIYRRRNLTRRSVLAGAAALAIPGSTGPSRAAQQTVPFGSAIQAEIMDADAGYRQAFLDHCDLVMPMNALKFDLLRPTRETWNFEPADKVVDFALRHGKTTRGTCHVWWGATPDWITMLESEADVERALVEHIERVCDRYRGRLVGWDVVNEVIANDPFYDGQSLRDTFWLRKLGPRHIPIAFEATARADPEARLVINEYDLEYRGPHFEERRVIMLSIVRQLQDANIRVDAVGLQAHLYMDREIDADALLRFSRELDALGVKLIVTELDVIDWQSPADPEAQDAAALEKVSTFLDAIFAWKPPEAVITWGMTDRYSWINDVMPRPDGNESRPLPLDRSFRPKPWLDLIKRRLASA